MEKFESVHDLIINDNIQNKWIRLGGFGILDGLQGNPIKDYLFKIVKVQKDYLELKAYKAKKKKFLPKANYNQEIEIYTQKEFGKLSRI